MGGTSIVFTSAKLQLQGGTLLNLGIPSNWRVGVDLVSDAVGATVPAGSIYTSGAFSAPTAGMAIETNLTPQIAGPIVALSAPFPVTSDWFLVLTVKGITYTAGTETLGLAIYPIGSTRVF